MKKQKVISAIVSIAAAFGGLGIAPASAAEEFTIADGYQFVDIAHHNETYVAMAKNSSGWAAAKLYTSTDGGSTWTSTRDISSAAVSANLQSQQQLVYWESEGIFVAHCAGATLTSSDGITWSNPGTLHLTSSGSNAVLTTSGDQLIISYTNGITATSSASNSVDDNLHGIEGISYPKAVAAKPADADGNICVLIHNQNRLVDLTLNVSNGQYTYTDGDQSYNQVITSIPVDMVYAAKAGQFLSVDGSESLFAAKSSSSYTKLVPKAGVNVTGVAANDDYIVVGMNDGTIYYTPNAELTSDTAWTQINGTAGSAVKNIELDGKGNFIALDSTNIYKGNLSEFARIDQYVEKYRNISAPTASVAQGETENPFAGVDLIGGAYSPTKDTYIVYGTDTQATTTEDYGDVKLGRIFTSSDNGQSWTEYAIDARHSFADLKNGAVWWESQGMFVISAYNQTNQGVLYTSEDGLAWTAVPTGTTGYVKNTELAVGGDYLYTTNGSRQLYKYSALDSESRTDLVLTPMKNENGEETDLDPKCLLTNLSVSNDNDPAIFVAGAYFGVVRNGDSEETDEIEKWRMLSHIGNASILDSVYCGNTDRFVALVDGNLRTSIITKDGVSPVQGPVITGGIVMTAIDIVGGDLMFACENGNIYTAKDDADIFATGNNSALVQVLPADGTDANAMTLTNVFAAGDKFVITASDDTDSAVYMAAKNNDGAYEYANVCAASGSGEFEPGAEITVSVDVENQEADDFSFTIIAAVFSPDNRCVQIETEEKTVSAFTNETAAMNVTINEDVDPSSTMRLFVWDSLDGMKPLTEVSVPFN